MMFDDWPLWKRAVTSNIIGVAGGAIGFASVNVKLSPSLCVPIAVFTLAWINFVMLVLRPQIVAAKGVGRPEVFPQILVRVVQKRPLILLLVINQLIGVSQLLTIAVLMAELLISGRIHTLPNASNINLGMVPIAAAVTTVVAAIWLLSAIGLWRSRRWAWWLAFSLNALIVVATIGGGLLVVLVLKQHGFLRLLLGWREAVAAVACVLLLLPVVRNEVRRRDDLVTL